MKLAKFALTPPLVAISVALCAALSSFGDGLQNILTVAKDQGTPTITGANVWNSYYDNLFDGVATAATDNERWMTGNPSPTPGWTSISFPSACTSARSLYLKQYRLYQVQNSWGSNLKAPTGWNLYGKTTDDGEWELIDSPVITAESPDHWLYFDDPRYDFDPQKCKYPTANEKCYITLDVPVAKQKQYVAVKFEPTKDYLTDHPELQSGQTWFFAVEELELYGDDVQPSSLPDCLLVKDDPENWGEGLNPGYGVRSGLTEGDEVPCSAPAEWTLGAITTTCIGYEVVADGEVVQSGPENNFTYVHPANEGGVTLTWKWNKTIGSSEGTRIWTGGGANNLASNPDNWDTGVPTMGDSVLLDGTSTKDMTWDVGMKDVFVYNWTQTADYTGTVTFETTYDQTFPYVEISNDVVLSGGMWTHKATGQTTKYRLKAVIGGDLTIAEDATITANEKGFDAGYAIYGQRTKRYSNYNRCGGSHGGYGFYYADYPMLEELYDSVSEPIYSGSGGAAGWGSNGGGAIWISVDGQFLHDGVITADSGAKKNSYWSGAGGSVYIRAGSISGRGTISASASAPNFTMPGGGGRVAIKLTGANADFSDYDVVMLVKAESPNVGDCGSPGTIYAETAADEPGKGWLIVKGSGRDAAERLLMTPFGEDGLNEFSRFTLTNAVTVGIVGGTLKAAETLIEYADVAGVRNSFCIKDGTLDFGEGEFSFGGNIVYAGSGSINAATLEFLPGGSLSVSTVGGQCGGNLVFDAGTAFTVSGPFSVSGNLTMTGATGTFKAPIEVGGNAALSGATKITTSAAVAIPTDKVDLTVEGDFTIGADAEINVTGCGYAAYYGPGCPGSKVTAEYLGGSYGGRATSSVGLTGSDPYGSIYDPLDFGSGAQGALPTAGGGVVLLKVGGALTLNGAIISDGVKANYCTGSGGSVNITAKTISGAGRISANGGIASSDLGPGAGGRIAVKLTGADADFAAWTGFMTAYGANRKATGNQAGAGTVYLQKGTDANMRGTLIVDSGIAATCADTLIGTPGIGATFGSVIISNALVRQAANAEVKVSGDWINAGRFEPGAGSVVRFDGAAASGIEGETTFAALVCEEPGKTLVFEAGKTQTVTELLQLAGESSAKIGVASSESGAPFTLNLVGAHLVNNVSLRDCTAAGGEMTALNSDDLGGNSNVKFISAEPGMTLTWTGASSDLWGDGGNWDASRAPLTTDKIVIPTGIARMPKLQTDATVLELSVGEGMVLSLNGRNLTVQGDLTVNGSVTAQGTEALSVTGDVVWNGTARFAGTLILAGTDAAQTFASVAAELGNVTVVNPNAAFSGGINCGVFACGDAAAACDYAFAPGFRLKTTLLRAAGDGEAKNVTLRGANSGSAWFLSASDYDITGVTVSDSDASGGVKIYPKSSADGGRNVNWAFVDNRVRWNGSVSADFGNPDNWDGGKVPGAADDAYVNVANPMQITGDAAVMLGSLTVGKDAQVTVRAPLTVSASVVIEGSGTLLWDVPGTIGGNLTILSGGVLTHTVSNGKIDPYKVDLTVGDSVYVAEGGAIHADAKGYSQSNSPVGAFTTGSRSHGGRGTADMTTPGEMAYGSILSPTNYGGSAKWDASTGLGGGAVRLAIAGSLTVDGRISSDAGPGNNSFYASSAGSVCLSASSLLGSGTITATGGSLGSWWAGGGGRISVVLSDGVFSSFGGIISAFGGALSGSGSRNGSAGTVYLADGTDKAGCGTIVIDGGSEFIKGAPLNLTDLPSRALCDKSETMWCKVVVRNGGCLNIAEDTQIKDLVLEGSSSTVRLNGHTLTVRSFQHALGTDESTQVIPGEGGTIAWDKPGFMIFVR